ncbi:MAG TPA: LLM class flavin-dependent oxidoreductase [Actinomycetota bacterium]|nr:LLM class flavin-dependent oxidoreductase [Actinomycetota bacterium]
MPRFGVSLRPKAGADPAAEARLAESLGFDLVTVMDHLPGERPSLETWTHLTWAAAATERILVAPNVLGLPYRNPAVTAKMAETLHRLSGGRFVLGLGAGGSNSEFQAFGLPVRSPKEKIDALEEAVDIIKALWTGEPVTREGAYYSVVNAQISPPPDTPIPLWLGTYGPRALRLTGRTADGWLPSYRYAPPDRWIGMRDAVRKAAEEAGRNPDDIEFAYNLGFRIDEKAEGQPGVLVGSANQVAHELSALANRGVTFFVMWALGDAEEQWELLAKEVVPAVPH